VLPKVPLSVTLGDQSLFEAVLLALGLPRGWRMRLARAFGSSAVLAAALADLANPSRSGQLEPAVAALVADGDHERLAGHIAGRMHTAGLSPDAGRSPVGIARRLIEKAELRSVRLADDAFSALKTFLSIRTPLDRAAAELSQFCVNARLSLGVALDAFSARVEAIEAEGVPPGAIRYDAAFGRPLDYYTGLVFEVAAEGQERPLLGGGRYDRLLTLLGAARPIPAVGFSVWLDRVEELREGAK
jgi:ATP phosphoribosyltransferase regulatory subunit